MNPIHLAGIVKRVYPNFDINLFTNRLKLQKLIYLMHAKGINLGYEFGLYLHGPYCMQLTRDGYEINNIAICPEIKFGDPLIEKKFLELINFLGDKKNNPDVMEILASLHLFKRLYPSERKEQIVKRIADKDTKFKNMEKKIEELYNLLKVEGLING
jgi:uncharacterized protein YwgA